MQATQDVVPIIVRQGNVCSAGDTFCVMSNKRNHMADLSLDSSPCQAWLQWWCAGPATDWESLIGQPENGLEKTGESRCPRDLVTKVNNQSVSSSPSSLQPIFCSNNLPPPYLYAHHGLDNQIQPVHITFLSVVHLSTFPRFSNRLLFDFSMSHPTSSQTTNRSDGQDVEALHQPTHPHSIETKEVPEVDQSISSPDAEDDELTYSNAPKLSLLRLFWYFFYNFGLFAWGGPVAQIALIKEQIVIKEKWITLARYQRVFAVYQILPGPEAAELCMFFGCLSAGRVGGIVAGLAFILPGFVLMLAASYLYTLAGLENIYFNASFRALQPIVAAMVWGIQ